MLKRPVTSEDLDQLRRERDDADRRYNEALTALDRALPRPSGGVGGTRTGVKCLHAHYAWHLAGGDDPVGRWVADHLREVDGAEVNGG